MAKSSSFGPDESFQSVLEVFKEMQELTEASGIAGMLNYLVVNRPASYPLAGFKSPDWTKTIQALKELQAINKIEPVLSSAAKIQRAVGKFIPPTGLIDRISSSKNTIPGHSVGVASYFIYGSFPTDSAPTTPDNQVANIEVTDYALSAPGLEETPKAQLILINELEKVKRIITDVYLDNSTIYRIGPRDFEEMIAELLRKQGFSVELTKQTRDGGYDILAINSVAGFPLKFLAECKRYAPDRPISVDIIRAFSYVIDKEKANKGIIFTTSYFTRDAKTEKNSVNGKLLDFMESADIIQWVNKYVK